MMNIVSVDEEKGLQLENRGETVLRTLLRILIKKKKSNDKRLLSFSLLSFFNTALTKTLPANIYT